MPDINQDTPMDTAPQGDAATILQQAIDLHAQHMSGEVPPTPESQSDMMTLLEQALAALSAGENQEGEQDSFNAVFGKQQPMRGQTPQQQTPSQMAY